MLESLEIVIEFGLGLAGFTGIVVALAGDPRNWSEGERVRVFGLITSALMASFSSFLCLTLAKSFPGEHAIRISASVFFVAGLFFFPRQVYRTFYVYRKAKENYSLPVSVLLVILTTSILGMALAAASGYFQNAYFLFYAAMVLSLLFAAVIYFRLLLYRPAGSPKKLSN